MARFTLHLKAQGASPRTMSGIYSDLNAGGLLVMCYQAPKGQAVLEAIAAGPPTVEFRRRVSHSARAMARFLSTWEASLRFLELTGHEKEK